ncbi:MAG: pyruvate carboxylase subunit B [Chloroflexi bacterium]|nr:pyruvate carboxylase subunit B [Chloroflexota bacterium]
MADNPVKISDTTFRDAHQSLIATRLRIEDMEPIAAEMDSMGFYSMEVWGGATFDVTTRFLGEDPWERLRTFRKLIPNTKLSMLLRGQSLVGYRAYADDVVHAFVQHSAETGIDIFRVFDALNDVWNLETAAAEVVKSGKHLQMAICYSVTESGRLGGDIFNLDYFLGKARQFVELGADSIAIKDMAGLLAPYDAFELVTALKAELKVPLQLHTHYTSGMASMTALKAIEAGVDIVDACLSPLALRTSQPAVEPLVVTLRDTERDSGLDFDKLVKMSDYLETALPRYKSFMESPRAAVIDPRVLKHQIPGGMTSNLVSQLREADALDRLDDVLSEIPKTRKDLGYPPLVTPTSQMVGSQSVSNVLFGRYKMVSGQVKDYVYGLYGRPPAPIESEVMQTALKDYEKGQTPISEKPSATLEPEMDRARDAVKDISSDTGDVLIYALYPTTGLKFLHIKHGQEEMPEDMKNVGRVTPTTPAPQKQAAVQETPAASEFARTFNVFVDGERFEVVVDPVGGEERPQAPQGGKPAKQSEKPKQKVKTSHPDAGPDDVVMPAPMPGLLLRYLVEEGAAVNTGDSLVVMEAMKMENTLPATASGTVKKLTLVAGASVKKGDVLAIITP